MADYFKQANVQNGIHCNPSGSLGSHLSCHLLLVHNSAGGAGKAEGAGSGAGAGAREGLWLKTKWVSGAGVLETSQRACTSCNKADSLSSLGFKLLEATTLAT